ncbi:hypothetical protein L596_022345 [Steinernema carpocapsae]|uniref:Uncharacterized protein n=1 Tax=Steinernema carpocapsae TaxID=34508 RepID=A0A4U5MLI5_STECR|nr:hypothetical protein L596_022345 [Steinernema carpocapsae]
MTESAETTSTSARRQTQRTHRPRLVLLRVRKGVCWTLRKPRIQRDSLSPRSSWQERSCSLRTSSAVIQITELKIQKNAKKTTNIKISGLLKG